MADNESKFYWEDPTGEICVKLVYDTVSRLFIGINVFGLRMRHEVMDDFLNNKRTVDYVLEHLNDANFDPEFYKLYEQDIVNKFNKEQGTSIQLKKKSWKRILKIS